MKYQERFSVNDGVLKAPFPWFGGKSRVAPLVWERFGDVTVYAEPFAGSLAVLLGRPKEHERAIESVNDKDGFVCNALPGQRMAACRETNTSEATARASGSGFLQRASQPSNYLSSDDR
jgi:hypothetical protein